VSRSRLSIRLRQCAGFSSLEVVVAFSLLTSVLALATPLIVAHGRLLSAQRDYRVALAEVSNQLERLSVLPASELAASIENLTPSSFAQQRLPGAKLRGELKSTDLGQRVALELTWDENNRHAAPVRLTAYVSEEAAP
jgi:hypothetical protein